ncbi:ARM repeat-containing protein [Dacryopinax primogenitus]|uniref:ARM repeat-containing protein n=1 Tax=Dacryopinax primogenitus (strain DJM 731) TaxID=1858805 RepID=M5FVV8_DACPD|nr:ARM repeat-containing protein [Dacryopinax primogenitus]EJU00494.1 ARM repeat-containing protein [Dacryopinax primogenitus]
MSELMAKLFDPDNQVRKDAENEFMNHWLAQQPEQTMLALAELCRTHPAPEVRSFISVMIRRHLDFELPPLPATGPSTSHVLPRTLYSNLSAPVLALFQLTLLHALDTEPIPTCRRKLVSAIARLVEHGLEMGRHWNELVKWLSNNAQGVGELAAEKRRDAFGILAEAPAIISDFDENAVGALLESGLKDLNVDVRLISLEATVAYLSLPTLPGTASALFSLALNTLASMPKDHLPLALQTFIPFASSRPKLFTPHLAQLLSFVLSFFGPGPTTPTPMNPTLMLDDDREQAQSAGLELLVSLSESASAQCKKVPGWTASILRICMEGMSGEQLEEWEDWETSEPQDDEDHSYPLAFEQAIDRLTICGKIVVPATFQYVPQMLQSAEWKQRHAGLMAMASLGEGGSAVLKQELGTIVNFIANAFGDQEGRVRFAACQCLGQLCTDMDGAIQQDYHATILPILVRALRDPVARVHAHTASALINFCEGVPKNILAPYLPDLVSALAALLSDNEQRYVQEQALTTLAMVADAAAELFSQFYGSVMPVLVHVMQNAKAKEYRLLRAKAMECAGLIAVAVGKDRFTPDAHQFCELLVHMQNEQHDDDDPAVQYLMGTWSKVCQTLGQDFEPYLPYAMPGLLHAAALKPEIRVFYENDTADFDSYSIIELGGQEIGIKTALLEEKSIAFQNLAIYAAQLGPKFSPYLPQSLELAIPGLSFVLHEGVREAAAMMIPQLLRCAQQCNQLSSAMIRGVFQSLVKAMQTETDPAYLQSLYTSFAHSMKVLGGSGAVDADVLKTFFDATQTQLHDMGDRRRLREQRVKKENIPADEQFDLELVEESEDSALTQMAAAIEQIDSSHQFLLVIAHIRELAISWTSDEE